MPRLRGEHGFAMSSPLALASGAAVLLAGVVFVATADTAQQAERDLAAAERFVVEPEVTFVATKVAPPVQRGEVYIDVYNNSNITGLAGRTSDRISGAGWQVVGSDNWYGTVPTTTIYYPPRLKEAAQMLSKDLGIDRLQPSVTPMNMDRLTVILTGDFA